MGSITGYWDATTSFKNCSCSGSVWKPSITKAIKMTCFQYNYAPYFFIYLFSYVSYQAFRTVQGISFWVQEKIKAIAGFHFHTLSSNPGSYWQQRAFSMQFSPIICENRDVEEANYLLERRKLLAYNWVLRVRCPLLEPHSSSHLPLRPGVLFLFKF